MPTRLPTQVARIHALLDRAQDKLSGDGLSPATAFFSSLLILLREGLEAILVLAAIIAFVRKTGRREAMPWIHAGWIGAVALGVVTWFVAERVITISGANRELTEGITALIAAGMLLYVGYWLHSKSYAQAWQHFIRDQVSAALGKGTVWALAGVSFLAVYREAFEIVLFYQALWVQAGESGRHAVLGGVAAAAVLLALLAVGHSEIQRAAADRTVLRGDRLAAGAAGGGVRRPWRGGAAGGRRARRAARSATCRSRCSACIPRCKAWVRRGSPWRWC